MQWPALSAQTTCTITFGRDNCVQVAKLSVVTVSDLRGNLSFWTCNSSPARQFKPSALDFLNITSVIPTWSSSLAWVSRSFSVPSNFVIGRCYQVTPSTVTLIKSTVHLNYKLQNVI